MSATGLKAFDTTIQTTNIWLDEIMRELGWHDRQRAWHALRAVLHTLRDHLSIEENAQLSAQLPLLVRGVYFEAWHPTQSLNKERSQAEFISHISESFALDLTGTHPRLIVGAVLKVLEQHLSAGGAASLMHLLPERVRELLV
jgi:uncharacterized protein (DUF2267 family)